MKEHALFDSPFVGLLLVPGALIVLLLLLRYYQVSCKPHPETVRKLMHSLMGALTLSFPWLFSETWPVWFLAGGSVVLLFSLRALPVLRDGVSNVINAVDRNTLGELYFPLAVACVFQFSAGNLVLYLVPVMVLSFADAMAAVVGLRYGQLRYQTSEGEKSLEGSIAFLLVATLCIHVPLLLLSDLGRSETLLIALLLGMLVMLFEAIAWRGLDNLFIPFACFFLLQEFIAIAGQVDGASQIAIQLAVVSGLSLLVLLLRKRTTLDAGAALAVVIVLYLVWSLQSAIWLLAPVSYLLIYSLLAKRANQCGSELHSVFSVLSVSAAGFVWIFIDKLWPGEVYFYCFTLSYAVQLALTGTARLMDTQHPQRTELSKPVVFSWVVLQGWVLIALPAVFIGHAVLVAKVSILMLLAIVTGVLVFMKWQPGLDNCPVGISRWYRQGITALVFSTMVLIVYG